MRRFAFGVVLLVVGAGLSCGGAPSGDTGRSDTGRSDTGRPSEEADSPPLLQHSLAAGADVVLVTIDTLRADALGFAGNETVATPNLDRIAREGRVFTSAYAHNVVTLPSHANILTGLYPHQHGVRENSGFKLAGDVPTLATILKEAGYATGAFVAAFPLDARFGLDRGFDVYDDRYPSGSHADQFRAAERRGDTVVPLAIDWWRDNSGSRASSGCTSTIPTRPYAAPEPYASLLPERPYLAEVSATDAYLGLSSRRFPARTRRSW